MKDTQARFKLTIGAKLIGLIALLLTSSIAGVSYVSQSMYVKNDKLNIENINVSTTATLVQQVGEILSNTSDKAATFGTMLVRDAGTPEAKAQFVREFFEKDKEFLALYVEKSGDAGALTSAQKAVSPELSAQGDADGEKALAAIVAEKQFSSAQLFSGEAQVALVKLGDGNWAIALGMPLIQSESDKSKFSHAAIALIKQSKIGVPFKDTITGETYLVDRKGNVLAHSDATKVGENLSQTTLVQQTFAGQQAGKSVQYTDNSNELHLAAYKIVKFAGTSLGAVSDVPATQAYEQANTIARLSALVGLIILFLAFWAGYLYSGSITRPIKMLVAAAQRIAEGDFKIDLKPKSRDEIAQLSLAFNDMAKGLEERDRVKDTFNKFHNKEIAEKLLSGEVKLGGERKEATIFFSDVRGFTAMSETMEPEQVVEMLNEYMTVMVSVIRQHSGIVDKYVGDAIMALWGVPLGKNDDTYQALRACLTMRVELAKLNELRVSRGQHPLRIGMGLNVGPVIAGNIGSVEKMEYTVIGDSVNLASRMESMTKEYGTDLLIPKAIHDKVKDRFIFEKCKSAKVKGKATAIEIYKVKGYYDADGKAVVIETAYSSYEAERSDKVVHETPAVPSVPAVVTPIAESDGDTSKLIQLKDERSQFIELNMPKPAPPAPATPLAQEHTMIAAAPSLPPPTDSEVTWYLNMSGTILGPFSSVEIDQGYAAHEFSPETEISSSIEGPWTQLGSHPSFGASVPQLGAEQTVVNLPPPAPEPDPQPVAAHAHLPAPPAPESDNDSEPAVFITNMPQSPDSYPPPPPAWESAAAPPLPPPDWTDEAPPLPPPPVSGVADTAPVPTPPPPAAEEAPAAESEEFAMPVLEDKPNAA